MMMDFEVAFEEEIKPCPAGCECNKHLKNGRAGKYPIICLGCGRVTNKPKFCGRDCSNKYSWSESGPRFSKKKQKKEVVVYPKDAVCSIEGCASGVFSRGWCKNHYSRWSRSGDPLPPAGAVKCTPGCTCGKHRSGLAKDLVPSLPCLKCNKVKMVSPCYGAGGTAPRKFCDRDCYSKYQEQTKAARRASGDTRKYDMSDREYKARLAAQGGKCAICTKQISGKDAHRDHCHKTGEWRGLLCSNCNLGLGNFQDCIEFLESAISYLTKGVESFVNL